MPLAPVPVDWEVASDGGFRDVVAKGTELAHPELGHSVHVEVAGLKADRPYYYRFTAAGERSLRGRARTLPAVGASIDALKFGVRSEEHTSELQSLMRISYAVFCLKKNNTYVQQQAKLPLIVIHPKH